MNEFLMAGKNMSIIPVGFSLMATFMSAIAIIGTPAEIYMYGTQFCVWLIGLPIGCMIASYGCLPTYYDLDVSTAYEYLEMRFGKTTRKIAGFTFILRSIFYTAVVLYSPSLALNAVTGLSTWTSILSLAAVCTFYCSLGGLKAVLWTDVFQATLMFVAVASVVLKGVSDMGFTEILDISDKGGRLIFFNMSPSLTERYTFWNSFLSGIFFGFETFGTNQAQVQRFLSVGNLKKAQWALFLSLILIIIFKVFCFSAGLVLYAIFYDCDPMQNPDIHLSSPDQIMPYSIGKLLANVLFLPGLCIAGMFSGALSSVSSSLNSMTAVTMEDFIRPHCHCKSFTDKWMNRVAKLLAIVFGGLSLLVILCVVNFRGVMEASNVLNGIPVGSIAGVYILAMFTTTANEPGILVGCVSGITVNAWIAIGAYLTKTKVTHLPLSIAGCTASTNETSFADHFHLYAQNSSSLFTTKTENIAEILNEENRFDFPLYTISFWWYPIIGMIVSVTVGYLSSLLIGCWKETPDINPKCISPFVRNLYFKSKESDSSKRKEWTLKV
ncbi:sodium-coupled monocarboxylate transporter 1 [Nephila pilipes]|uniref:Sodium-coupled monocarboxylate transporter 1 n=1 Tax=Nephila pilipes TaxID=299642 RepID=A0A8X6TLZ8_NEPPI|nr:sodium-coupled monocarboxylate transporter 1 [Nephila pilipes]